MPLMPADVRNKQFTTTWFRSGYDEAEVDDFLEEVETELDRLIQENEELRARLTESLQGGIPVSAIGLPLAAPVIETPVPPPLAPPAEGNVDTAARILALAQQTADQALADAGQEAEETVSRARREADELLDQARRQAEQATSDARARVENLERDGQERYRRAMGSLRQQREELERRVGDLRAFEHECRSRLKAYAEGLLRGLEASTDGLPAVPGTASDSQLVSVSGRAGSEPVGGEQPATEGT